MKAKLFLVLMILLFTNEIFAQKVKDTDLAYKYKRLPSSPINKNMTSYKGEVLLAYEEEDKKKLEEYEKKKAGSDEQFRKDKQVADTKYEKEKKEYKDQSFGKKLLDKAVLGQDNKPHKEYAGKEGVEKPFIHKTFDKDLLASTYIKLAGYQKSSTSDLVVTFTAFGIEHMAPTVDKGSQTALSGQNKGRPQPVYTMEMKYRSPVAVLVQTGKGDVILKETVEQTNQYSTWKSQTFESESQMNAQCDPEKIAASFEQKITEENMKAANLFLNEKCATSVVERKTVLYNVETKKLDYADYQKAYSSATEGYILLMENIGEASTKLKSAVEIWDKALQESNPKDKKARVNEEITIATIFNLAEACIWTNEYTKAKLVLAKALPLDLSRKEKKRIEDLKLLIADQEQRYEANKTM